MSDAKSAGKRIATGEEPQDLRAGAAERAVPDEYSGNGGVGNVLDWSPIAFAAACSAFPAS